MTAHRRDVESKKYKAHKLVKHLIEERLIEDFDDLSGLKTVIQCYHDYDFGFGDKSVQREREAAEALDSRKRELEAKYNSKIAEANCLKDEYHKQLQELFSKSRSLHTDRMEVMKWQLEKLRQRNCAFEEAIDFVTDKMTQKQRHRCIGTIGKQVVRQEHSD